MIPAVTDDRIYSIKSSNSVSQYSLYYLNIPITNKVCSSKSFLIKECPYNRSTLERNGR